MSRQFDIHRLADGQLVVDCQADALSSLDTRLAVPLRAEAEVPSVLPRLHPVFDVGGKPLVFASHLAQAIPVAILRNRVGSLADERYAIMAALDVLLTGV